MRHALANFCLVLLSLFFSFPLTTLEIKKSNGIAEEFVWGFVGHLHHDSVCVICDLWICICVSFSLHFLIFLHSGSANHVILLWLEAFFVLTNTKSSWGEVVSNNSMVLFTEHNTTLEALLSVGAPDLPIAAYQFTEIQWKIKHRSF